METNKLVKDAEFDQINQLYDECLNYLKTRNDFHENFEEIDGKLNDTDKLIENNYDQEDPLYEVIRPLKEVRNEIAKPKVLNGIIKVKQDENDRPENKQTNVGKLKNLNSIRKVSIDTNNLLEESNKNNRKDSIKMKLQNGEIVHKNENHILEIKRVEPPKVDIKIENELKSSELLNMLDPKPDRLRRLSEQLPKIIITQSTTSLSKHNADKNVMVDGYYEMMKDEKKPLRVTNLYRNSPPTRSRFGYGDFPKRLVSKSGLENVALISNVPYEKIRLLNDTFHTLINLRWRWIVSGTIVVHFALWLVFALFWYFTALAHDDFEPNPPKKTCITGGKDFVTIFLASVEAQTTIGFGDRAIDEECPESIFLFIMQLIIGTGLSGVLTCVVYAKLTRPEKLSRDGVGFSKKAVICMRDGRLCLMIRAWDLNHDHIISSEFNAHFINTYRTKEGEMIRYYARSMSLQQRQFLLWPVTLVHVIDATSPLYQYTPELVMNNNYEIAISLKGASASMGTFTQSQTSYMPREIIWGHRFPPVVKYDSRKQKYVIEHKKLDSVEKVDTPLCSAHELYQTKNEEETNLPCPGTPSSFSEKISAFVLERSSSFRHKDGKSS